MKTNIILNGDSLTHLKELPDNSIDCVITSPPYWALRDYGVEGQLGLVALKNNRQFIGIELNPEYIKIAEERLRPYLEQEKLVI